MGQHMHYQFLYALQSPFLVFFIRVTPKEVVVPPLDPVGYFDRLASTWAFEFDWAPEAYVFSDSVSLPAEANIMVLNDVVFLDGTRLGSDGAWQPLEEFLARLPRTKGDTHGRPTATKSTRVQPGTLEVEPWLLDFLNRPKRTCPSTPATCSSSSWVASVGADEDLDVDEVFEELEGMRVEMGRDEAARGGLAFSWNILGGSWTMRHRQVAFDAFQAKAMSAAAKEFVRSQHMAASCRFSINLYGECACAVLCEYWVEKMQHFFGIWEAAGRPADLPSLLSDHRDFEEPIAFQDLARGASGQLLGRITDLRDLHP